LFEFASKDKTISLRLSQELLDAVKAASAKKGIGYQKFIRELIERAVKQDSRSSV
jgi:predicted DNA binding CopG/RHH family protein